MFIPYSNLQPSWLETSLAEVLHISRIALWRMVLVLVLAVGTAGILGLHSADEVSESRSRFIEAFGSLRVLEGRLVSFPYEPLPHQAPSPKRIAEAARSFHRWAERQPPSQVAAEMALLRLMEGKEGKRDLAIESLERIAQEQIDASSLSDLAAAYLDRGSTEGRPLDLLKALDASSKAVKLDPDLPEARYNQALALEKLVLVSQARSAWVEYVRKDSVSEWIIEAEEHSRNLAEDTDETKWKRRRGQVEQAAFRGDSRAVQHWVAQHRQRARLFAEETLLPTWADAWMDGRGAEAARTLQAVRSIGTALAVVEGDWMVQDAVASIDKEIAASRFDRVARMALGHWRLAEGLRLHRIPRDQEARELLESAASLLQESPFSLWARFHAGSCDFYEGDTVQLQDRLEGLMLDLDRERYPNLSANVLSLKGMAEGRLAHLDKSLRAYRTALALFQKTGELGSIAAIHFMIAENFRFQGDSESAWSHRLRALRLANDSGGSIYYHNSLLDGAESALRGGFPKVALLFHREMVWGALRRHDPLSLAETFLRRSHAYKEVGQTAAAVQDLETARYWLDKISQGERQRRLRADLDAAEGKMWLGQKSERAVERLTSAIELYLEHESRFALPELYLARARAFLELGDLSRGELDLAAGIDEIEAQRDSAASPLLRAIYLDQARATFDEMIRMQAAQLGRPDKAFEYAERYHAQELNANWGSGIERTVSPKNLIGHLPVGSALVQYEVLADRVLVWVATSKGFYSHSLNIGRGEVDAAVRLLFMVLGTPKEIEILATLYDQLMRPIEGEIRVANELLIVPDESLHKIPFAALFHRGSRSFVVQDYLVSYVISATFLTLSSLRRDETDDESFSRALVIGNPAFDRQLFPKLENLPYAATEATLIGSLYENRNVLIGRSATEKKFLGGLEGSDVVHYGGHAVVNPDLPSLSALVLAPERDGQEVSEGVLYAYEIDKLQVNPARLVILAGCQTAGGRIFAGEGVVSLARPFLAVGVASVVGSLWRVDDKSTSELFVSFHRFLREGESPAEALRNAQLYMLEARRVEGGSPFSWGGFKLIGRGY